MMDWLKYFPLDLRDAESDDWRGPDLARSRRVEFSIGGSWVKLRAPRHASRFPQPEIAPKRWIDSLQGPFNYYNGGLAANRNWVQNSRLHRSWTYRKPWFAGPVGELIMHMEVVKRSDEKEFDGPSFFHPATFVYVISNYLDTLYGHHETEGVPDYRGPLCWATHSNLPVVSASFQVEGVSDRLFYVFPATSKCFAKLSFSFMGHKPGLREDMERVAKHIISTVTLELSPEAQAQLDAVKAECPDMSLPETFAPLKWPIKKEDIGKGEILRPTNPEDEFFTIY